MVDFVTCVATLYRESVRKGSAISHVLPSAASSSVVLASKKTHGAC